MRISAVTVCVNYEDFLIHCLSNLAILDRWVIVTTSWDSSTINLCRDLKTELVIKDDWVNSEEHMDKGKGINYGIDALRDEEWILIMDADIILPFEMKEAFEASNPNPRFLYGMSRLCAQNRESFLAYQQGDSSKLFVSHDFLAGFFQLYNRKIYPDRRYVEGRWTGRNTDWMFKKMWPTNERKLIQGMRCINVGPVGKNVATRITSQWKVPLKGFEDFSGTLRQ